MLIFSTNVFAVSTAEVYADQVIATTDKTVLIPVKIKNNSGIMGFKITVSYDKTVLGSPKITSGDITHSGMINDSIGVTPEGKFDIVWSGIQNETADGTLFVISFKSVKAEDTKIRLSYSQPDTFNEAWEDVELKCSDISVEFADEIAEKETVTSANQPSAPPDSEEIKNAVDIVLGETGNHNIDNIPLEETDEFIDRTNDILGQLTGNPTKPFESIDEIRDVYNEAIADEFIEDAKLSVDSDKIETVIKNSLEAADAESIEQIPDEKKVEFVQTFENSIVQYAPDIDTISDKLTADEAVKVIQQLQNENDVAATEGVKLPEPSAKISTATIIVVVIVVGLIVAIITVASIYSRRKK